jgi:hypothetical protein
MTSISKYNKLIIGLIAGMIVPFIALFAFYFFKRDVHSISEYMMLIRKMEILSSVISLCALPNLLVFFLFLWKNYYYSARGVILATFLWAVVVLITRFFLNQPI